MPTGYVNAYTNIRVEPAFDPESALMKHCNLATGTYAAGTVIGELTATPGTFKAYLSGASDGSQIPKGILRYGCVVDGSGNISLGDDLGSKTKSIEFYIAGYFQSQDLIGLDANALTVMNGRIVQGTITTGVVKI